MPGIFHPSHLVPSAHAQPSPDSEDSSEIEGFISDDETDNAKVGEAAGDGAGNDGGERSSLSGDTQADHPKGTIGGAEAS